MKKDINFSIYLMNKGFLTDIKLENLSMDYFEIKIDKDKGIILCNNKLIEFEEYCGDKCVEIDSCMIVYYNDRYNIFSNICELTMNRIIEHNTTIIIEKDKLEIDVLKFKNNNIKNDYKPKIEFPKPSENLSKISGITAISSDGIMNKIFENGEITGEATLEFYENHKSHTFTFLFKGKAIDIMNIEQLKECEEYVLNNNLIIDENIKEEFKINILKNRLKLQDKSLFKNNKFNINSILSNIGNSRTDKVNNKPKQKIIRREEYMKTENLNIHEIYVALKNYPECTVAKTNINNNEEFVVLDKSNELIVISEYHIDNEKELKDIVKNVEVKADTLFDLYPQLDILNATFTILEPKEEWITCNLIQMLQKFEQGHDVRINGVVYDSELYHMSVSELLANKNNIKNELNVFEYLK